MLDDIPKGCLVLFPLPSPSPTSSYCFVFLGRILLCSPDRCRGQVMQRLVFLWEERESVPHTDAERGQQCDHACSQPRAIQHCNVILVRWEISPNEIRCTLLIPEGTPGLFSSESWGVGKNVMSSGALMKHLWIYCTRWSTVYLRWIFCNKVWFLCCSCFSECSNMSAW